MFQSTLAESFHSWENFLGAYYEPIRRRWADAVRRQRLADDYAQSFFLKMVERDFLANRPVITGRFRNWLYVAAKNHAVDEWRKIQRRPEQPTRSTCRSRSAHPGPARRHAVRCRRVLRTERPSHDGRPGAQALARGRKVGALDDLRRVGARPVDPRPRPQDARRVAGHVPRPGPRRSGQPRDDRQAQYSGGSFRHWSPPTRPRT